MSECFNIHLTLDQMYRTSGEPCIRVAVEVHDCSSKAVRCSVLTVDENDSLYRDLLNILPGWEGIIHHAPPVSSDALEPQREIVSTIDELLDYLVEHSSSCVRSALAAGGYALEKLINDPDPRVAEAAQKKLAEMECESNDE